MDSGDQVERHSDVDENNICSTIHKEVNLNSLHHKEEKDMTKLFHIKIQVKKTKVYVLYFLFNYGS
jgi:hypothetical protein